MTSRLVLSRKDPLRTNFELRTESDVHAATSMPRLVYTSDTTHYARPRNGCRATTTITRTDHTGTGDRLQVGVIEWPVVVHDPAVLVVGTREVRMAKSKEMFAASERFTAVDGHPYEWQIQDARPQLVPLRGYTHTSPSYVATFIQSQSGFCLRRKHTSSLFVPPEGIHILDDILVTFIYFESKRRDKQGRSRASLFSGICTM